MRDSNERHAVMPDHAVMHDRVMQCYSIAKSHDLSRVSDFLIHREGLSDTEVREAIEEYRKHMAILAAYAPHGTDIPVSDGVDPVWHTHILHTGDYFQLCRELGCEYIHHRPFVFKAEVDEIMPAYRDVSCALHAKHFGINEKFWGRASQPGCMNKP